MSAVCAPCSRKRVIFCLGKQNTFKDFLKMQRQGPEPNPHGEVGIKAALHGKIKGCPQWVENGMTLDSLKIFGNSGRSLGLGGYNPGG